MSKRYIAAAFAALVFVGLTIAQSITITDASSPKAGHVNAKGTYTLPDGWVVVLIEIEVRPPKGAKGEGGEKNAAVDNTGKTFTGTVDQLPAGTYDVQAKLRVSDPKSKFRSFYSETKTGIQVK